MNSIKVILIIVCISFLTPLYSSFEDDITADRCFTDQTSLTIFDYSDLSINNGLLYAHGGGLNKCGCHFNRKTNECHCHRNTGCGCECQPSSCS